MKNYFLCILLLVVSTYNYGQGSFLDSTFGNNGKVVTDFGSEEGINSIAFQRDGKIVAGGYYDLIKKNLAFDFIVCALARYTTNGKLDSSFGKDGFAYFKQVFAQLNAIIVQDDNKIVGTGYAYPIDQGPAQLIMLRCKKNGGLDSSFGTNGIVYFGDLKTNFIGKAMALQDDGKFVVAGINNTINSWDSSFVFAARFNNNGTLDSSFGTNGSKKIVVGFQSYATGIAINSKGEIIIAGYNITSSGFSQPILIGLTSSGELNKNFGDKGITVTNLKYSANISSTVLTGNDKIIVGGSVQIGDNNNFLLIKYTKFGIVDSSFGINGVANSDLDYSDQITSIVIQPDDKIVAAGNSFDAVMNETYFALSRYYSNGQSDTSFGTQGRILTSFSGHTNTLGQILLQPDGKIIAGGTSARRRYGYGDFALSRYINDSNEKIRLQIPIASSPGNHKEKVIAFVTTAR